MGFGVPAPSSLRKDPEEVVDNLGIPLVWSGPGALSVAPVSA